MQMSKTSEREKVIQDAERDYNKAFKEYTDTWVSLIELVAKIYGREKADDVSKGTIWMGMPMRLLLIAKGKADYIKESIYKEKITERWYYGERITRVGTSKYTLEIRLEDDIIVGWKDLE